MHKYLILSIYAYCLGICRPVFLVVQKKLTESLSSFIVYLSTPLELYNITYMITMFISTPLVSYYMEKISYSMNHSSWEMLCKIMLTFPWLDYMQSIEFQFFRISKRKSLQSNKIVSCC